jgi:hypothetical protein
LWKIDENGKQMLPQGGPLATQPISMKNQDDILKELSSFIEHWESLAQKDFSGSYARFHGNLIAYWKGM